MLDTICRKMWNCVIVVLYCRRDIVVKAYFVQFNFDGFFYLGINLSITYSEPKNTDFLKSSY